MPSLRDEATSPRSTLGRIAELLEQSNIDVSEIGRIDKVRIGEHEVVTKRRTADGEDVVETHTARADSLVLTPAWATGPEWPVVQPAKPVALTPKRAKPRRKGTWRRAVILPDPQIGYRRYDDGTMDPFHDEAAMSVALGVAAAAEPDRIINLGDTMDFAVFGRFDQEPAFAMTTQATLDRTHEYLADQVDICPTVDLLEGNHDRRLLSWIMKNAAAAFGIRQANLPESWPVFSVPHLLRLDELGVTYHEGYPAAICWINDNLAAIHGHKVRSAGSTAAAVVDDERVSVIFGHVHRIERQHKTRRTRNGARTTVALTPGCLCRTDGAVPSTKGSTDSSGRPVLAVEDWQQGLAVVDYEVGDGRFDIQLVPIHDAEGVKWARWMGDEFATKVKA